MKYTHFSPAPITVPIVGTDLQFPVHRIYCVGRNYVEHAKEMGFSGREAPFFFLKPADALVVVPQGQTGTMAYPPLTQNLHHEIELVVAIGVGGKHILAVDAASRIAGYAVGLDMTRRDLQNEMKKLGRPGALARHLTNRRPWGPSPWQLRCQPLAKPTFTCRSTAKTASAARLTS